MMPITYKILGQSAPAPGVRSLLYKVPAATQAVISTIVLANHLQISAPYKLLVKPDGATVEKKHYLIPQGILAPGDSVTLTLGITLGSKDEVIAESPTGEVSFNLFGSEIT